MGFDLQHGQMKRVRFCDEATEQDVHDKYEKTSAGEKLHEIGCTNGDHVIGIPVNTSWGTSIMGDPAKPTTNPDNDLAAACIAPQLTPADINVKFEVAESPNGHTDDKTRSLHDGKPPVMQSDPYVLNHNTPASTPLGKCKAPFVPSLKNAPKFLSFRSFLVAQIDAFMARLNRWSKNANSLTKNFCSHMKVGSSVSETVWGKLNLGAKILTVGGLENLFKLSFCVGPAERLLKTSACHLSTSTGPVVGLLFISTEKLTFCSDRALSFTSPLGGIAWSYYRVVIPLGRVSSVNPFENVNKPVQKYIQILTVDNHEFWFMGFVNYHKAFKHIQEAVRSRQLQL